MLADDAFSDGHSAVLFSVNVTTGVRESLPLQDFARNLECLFNVKSSVYGRTAVSARGFGNSIFGCLTLLQCARVVGASRSCRSRRYTLVPLLSVATLSSPGPRAQHPTSHRVGRLVTDDLAFDGNKFCVVADRCVRPCWRSKRIQSIEQRKCISYFHRPLVGAGLCACPFGVSVIVARGQAWKPAATRNNYLFTTHLSLYQAD